MLSVEGTLTAIAELALTLTGFAALIGIYRNTQQRWTRHELIGQYIILELSLSATFFCVLPIALFFLSNNESNLWRAGSAISMVFAVGWLVTMYTRVRKARKVGYKNTINPLIRILLFPFSLGMILLLVLNTVWLDLFAIYFLNILWMMMISGTQFIIFVYEYAHSTLDDEPNNTETKSSD